MEAVAQFRLGHLALRSLFEHANMEDLKYRPDFEMTFSANSCQEIWNFTTFGLTRPPDKHLLHHDLLKMVVAKYACVRPELGRFHIDQSGAYYGCEKRRKIRFLTFQIENDSVDPYSIVAGKSLRKMLTFEHIFDELARKRSSSC